MRTILENEIPKILDSQEYIERTNPQLLFNNIASSLINKYPAYYDIINTYEDTISHIEDIVSKESVLDDFIHTNVPNTIIKINFYIDNIKVYGPNTTEFKSNSSSLCNAVTPNEALALRKTYCLLLIGDINFKFTVISVSSTIEPISYSFKLESKWNVNVPMPVGCRWCTLREVDPELLNKHKSVDVNLIRTGEDMSGFYGLFIIGGFLKHLIPFLNKPFNMPIIMHNEYENQLSRSECLYTSNFDYENSYYIIGSMIRPKVNLNSKSNKKISAADFIFSLQFSDPVMNEEYMIGRRKALINSVPIRYLFYAFGCKNDLELIKYICPDMSDFGLVHSVRQACLEGQYHLMAIQGSIDYDFDDGYINIKNLNQNNAKFIIGNIILSENYKKELRSKFGLTNNVKSKSKRINVESTIDEDQSEAQTISETVEDNQVTDINYYKYRAAVIKQVETIFRTKFMPGIGKSNYDESLYNIDKKDLTEEQKKKIEQQEEVRNKALCYEIGSIVKELYNIGNDITPSMDKISLLNRRIRSGQQIEYEFKAFNNARMREVKINIEDFCKDFNTVKQLTNKDTLNSLKEKIEMQAKQISHNQTTSILNAFKGVVTKDKSRIRTDLLTPKNQTFVDAMLREIVISTDEKANTTGVQWPHRVVHPSHLYFIDPVFSPESGKQVGRYQQPTLYTYLTIGTNPRDIIEIIKQNPNVEYIIENLKDKYIIKVNGSIVGYIKEFEPVENLYKTLMEYRRQQKIPKDCTISLDHIKGILEIWCDAGRLITVFVNARNSFELDEANSTIVPRKEFIDWINTKNKYGDINIDYGIEQGFIEYCCSTMTVFNFTVAETLEEYYNRPWLYSHIALPLHILSYTTCVNPCVQLNAGVRASYSSNHTKQAIGPTNRYSQIKYLNENNVLLSPEVPLVRTCTYDMIKLNEKPTGQNVTIAFLAYTDNQEDSFIINKSSLDSGLFVIDSIVSESLECTRQEEVFKIPDEDVVCNGNSESYKKLNKKTCLPGKIGEKFYENDALIGKVIKMNKKDNKYTDRSITNTKPDGTKDYEFLLNEKYKGIATNTFNQRELRCVCIDDSLGNNDKLKIACFGQRRIAIAGDKFNSMNAQKGTIGRIYDSTKMPYTSNGLRPDIIFNPTSIFKRKTIGQIYEPTIGKLAALLGCPVDTTPYMSVRSTDDLDSIYEQLGLDNYGYEDIYDPETGLCIGKAFVGVMHYQRQQHLVENKLNVRAGEGDIDRVTSLPSKGRRKNGGQSVDAMSCKCYFAAGASNVYQDFHINQGAKTTIAFCRWCNKQFTYYDNKKKTWICSSCGQTNDFCIKEVVPAENLMNQIMTGMHICFEYTD